MSDTTTVSPVRQHMIEVMAARKLSLGDSMVDKTAHADRAWGT
jgi:hypothetical protein